MAHPCKSGNPDIMHALADLGVTPSQWDLSFPTLRRDSLQEYEMMRLETCSIPEHSPYSDREAVGVQQSKEGRVESIVACAIISPFCPG